MNELSPAVLALKIELGEAIRRDQRRRVRRRKTLGSGALSLFGLVVVSSAALAAVGDAPFAGPPVEEVQFAHGVSVEAVKSFAEFTGKSSEEFVTKGRETRYGAYIYHVTGGEATELGCPFPDIHPTNNIYILSKRPLTSEEIESQLKPDGELNGFAPRLAGVTSESDGCPNPGVAGQPGTPNGPITPGKTGVAVAHSNRTPAILPDAVPTSSSSGATPTTTSTAGNTTNPTPTSSTEATPTTMSTTGSATSTTSSSTTNTTSTTTVSQTPTSASETNPTAP